MNLSLFMGDCAPWLWLSLFTASLLCAVASWFEYWFPGQLHNRRLRLGTCCSLVPLVVLVTVDLLSGPADAMRGSLLPWRGTVLLFGILAAGAIAWMASTSRRSCL